MTPEMIMAAAFNDELEKISSSVSEWYGAQPNYGGRRIKLIVQRDSARKHGTRTVPSTYKPLPPPSSRPSMWADPAGLTRSAPKSMMKQRAVNARIAAQTRNEAKARVVRRNTTRSGQHLTVD